MQNNRKPCYLLQIEDEACLFTDIELLNHFVQDALDFVEEWEIKQTAARELWDRTVCLTK